MEFRLTVPRTLLSTSGSAPRPAKEGWNVLAESKVAQSCGQIEAGLRCLVGLSSNQDKTRHFVITSCPKMGFRTIWARKLRSCYFSWFLPSVLSLLISLMAAALLCVATSRSLSPSTCVKS